MDKLKATVLAAKEMNKFVSELKLLNPSEFDIRDIISLKPDFDETIQNIRNWIIPSSIEDIDDAVEEIDESDMYTDEDLIEEEPVSKLEPIVFEDSHQELTPVVDTVIDKDIVEDFKNKQQLKSAVKYNSMSKVEKDEYVENICYIIANKCTGMPRLKALKEIVPLYQDVPDHVLRGIISKSTYLHVSDKYFSLDKDDNIVDTRHVINGRGVYYINGYELTESTFLELKGLLMTHNYSIKNLITDKIITTKADVMDCLRTKIIMNQNGDIVIGEEDLAIMISDVIDRVGKRKTTKIDQMLEKDWNITGISGNTISDIINKRIYREISDMFFA